MVVSDAPMRSITERFDFALRYGDGSWPGYEARHLFDVDSSPVCTPDYLRKQGPIASPADLTRHTLLNLDGTVHAMEDWTWWLKGQGVTSASELTLLGFDNYANVIQAALEGQGVALGFSGIVDHLLDRRALTRPVGTALSRGQGVFALTPIGTTLNPAAQVFFDWIMREAGIH